MSTQKISFTNNEGQQLSARLDLPINQHPAAYAIFAHCFTCNKNLTAINQVSTALTQQGFGVLRFDFTGLGESEGDFSDTDFSANISDLLAVSQYMEKELAAPRLLIGHSLGGAAALFAASMLPSVEAIATIAAPADPSHIKHLLRNDIADIEKAGKAIVEIGGREFTIKKQFLDDLATHDLPAIVKEMHKPILLLHSPQDTIVGIDNAALIYSAAHHPKSFVSLDGADHLLSNKNDSDYAGEVIATWAKRYIVFANEEVLRPVKKVMVQIGEEGFTSKVIAGQHSLLADEPVSVGGNDFGPTPYDYLLTALGACTAMTLRMYADRKQWPVAEINVHLDHNEKHALDCDHCEDPTAKIDHIDRFIEVKGNLDDSQLKRLLEIADKCPVHKTLHAQVEIRSEMGRIKE